MNLLRLTATRLAHFVGQKVLTFPEHLRSPHVFIAIRVIVCLFVCSRNTFISLRIIIISLGTGECSQGSNPHTFLEHPRIADGDLTMWSCQVIIWKT